MTEDEWKRSEIAAEPNSVLLSELKILGSQSKLQDRVQKQDPYWIFIACIFVFVGALIVTMFFIGCYKQKSTFKRKLKEQELIHDKLKSESRVVNIEIPLSSTNEKIKFDVSF